MRTKAKIKSSNYFNFCKVSQKVILKNGACLSKIYTYLCGIFDLSKTSVILIWRISWRRAFSVAENKGLFKCFFGLKLYRGVVEFHSDTNWVRMDDVFSWAVTQSRPHTQRGTPLETQLLKNLSSKWWLEKCQFVKSVSLTEIMYLSCAE